ncbi:MAG: sialate O-acetylesterase [Pirellulales bacterium]
MKTIRSLRWLVVASLFALPQTARAEVALPPFFSDHMVLQRETKAPVWGTAAPGEAVVVKFRDQELKTTADDKGNWRVELVGLKAGGPDELTVNNLKFTDVLVGEVWVGSGQSNMAGTVRGYAMNDPVLAKYAANSYPKIRGCSAKTGWRVSSPEDNIHFSAILFGFAVPLHEQLDVPVGMILGAVGGTPSGAWVSEQRFKEDAICQKLVEEYAKTYDQELADFEKRILPAWKKGAEAAKAAGKQVGREPAAPFKPGTAKNAAPGYLYEAHIRPVVGYGIRGVLWDQGESRTAVGGVDQFSLMVRAHSRVAGRLERRRVPLPLCAKAERRRLRVGPGKPGDEQGRQVSRTHRSPTRQRSDRPDRRRRLGRKPRAHHDLPEHRHGHQLRPRRHDAPVE